MDDLRLPTTPPNNIHTLTVGYAHTDLAPGTGKQVQTGDVSDLRLPIHTITSCGQSVPLTPVEGTYGFHLQLWS